MQDSSEASDPYGFVARFRKLSLTELIDTFNSEVGKPGWTHSRSLFLEALRKEVLSRNVDCSAVIDETGMKLDRRVELRDARVVQVSTESD